MLVSYQVGVIGFEPTAPRSQSECSTKLSYTPLKGVNAPQIQFDEPFVVFAVPDTPYLAVTVAEYFFLVGSV